MNNHICSGNGGCISTVVIGWTCDRFDGQLEWTIGRYGADDTNGISRATANECSRARDPISAFVMGEVKKVRAGVKFDPQPRCVSKAEFKRPGSWRCP